MNQNTAGMARRALLTEGEREAIENPDSKENPYVAISRIRNKIDGELPRDVELLREHRPDLFEELQAVVCEGPKAEPEPEAEPAPPERREFGVRDDQVPTTDDGPEAADEREKAEKRIRELELAGSGDSYESRLEATLKMYDLLRENPLEFYEKDDFRNLLEDDDVGYAGGFASLWGNWIKSNKAQERPTNTLEELPGVEIRGDHYVYMDPSEESQ